LPHRLPYNHYADDSLADHSLADCVSHRLTHRLTHGCSQRLAYNQITASSAEPASETTSSISAAAVATSSQSVAASPAAAFA
jgi:hypothetical protein